jgi:hypothetical protein
MGRAMRLDIRMFALLAVGTLAGCMLEVAKLDPRPNVAFVQPSPKSLVLRMTPDIAGDVSVHDKETNLDLLEVHQWRDTLAGGFTNAFVGQFKALHAGETADLVLEIRRAEIAIAPTAAGNRRSTFAVQLTYQARLLDGTGAVVKVAAATVASKRSTDERAEVPDLVKSAVETMFEDLSTKLF